MVTIFFVFYSREKNLMRLPSRENNENLRRISKMFERDSKHINTSQDE